MSILKDYQIMEFTILKIRRDIPSGCRLTSLSVFVTESHMLKPHRDRVNSQLKKQNSRIHRIFQTI
ncbi:MAG: hypothetical protein IPJ43_16560 [Saprospiraceae bacterium]|nr:hypothetical protein [Saprospiraceae bacterium]